MDSKTITARCRPSPLHRTLWFYPNTSKKVNKKWLFRSILQISNLMVMTFLCYALVYSLDAAFKSADQVGDIIPVSVIWVKLHLPLGLLFMLVHLAYFVVGVQLSDDPGEFMISK